MEMAPGSVMSVYVIFKPKKFTMPPLMTLHLIFFYVGLMTLTLKYGAKEVANFQNLRT
jgi:hypothetical protein